jgi:hypothetical protein
VAAFDPQCETTQPGGGQGRGVLCQQAEWRGEGASVRSAPASRAVGASAERSSRAAIVRGAGRGGKHCKFRDHGRSCRDADAGTAPRSRAFNIARFTPVAIVSTPFALPFLSSLTQHGAAAVAPSAAARNQWRIYQQHDRRSLGSAAAGQQGARPPLWLANARLPSVMRPTSWHGLCCCMQMASSTFRAAELELVGGHRAAMPDLEVRSLVTCF